MTVQHLHLMGIGGVGMCGIAEVLLSRGLAVSGCDLARSERTRYLENLGAQIHIGHDAAHVESADALVVTAAVPPGAPEMEAAAERGLPVIRRSEICLLYTSDAADERG